MVYSKGLTQQPLDVQTLHNPKKGLAFDWFLWNILPDKSVYFGTWAILDSSY